MAITSKTSQKIKQAAVQKAATTPYVTGPGSYNRESGNKTLLFVAIIISIIAILVIILLYIMHKKSSVMVQGITNEQQISR